MSTEAAALSNARGIRARQGMWVLAAVGGAAVLLAAWGAWYQWIREPTSQLLLKGRRAFAIRDFDAAANYTSAVLGREPESVDALLLASRTAVEQRRLKDAVEYLKRVPEADPQQAAEARRMAGDLLLLEVGNLPEAEEQLRRALKLNPDNPGANNRLAYLIGLGNGGWEARRHRIAMIRLGEFGPVHLWALAKTADVIEEEEILAKYQRATPGHPIVVTAMGRREFEKGNLDEATQLLRRAVAADPRLIGAQVALGRALLRQGRTEEFLAWNAALPTAADEHPETWLLRGRFAGSRGEREVAVRCLWESVRRNPNHESANYQLGQSLVAVEREEEAGPFLERAGRLEKYVKASDSTTRLVEIEVRKTAELAKSLGLVWEVYGWSRFALQQDPRSAWARELVAEMEPKLTGLTESRLLDESNPALKIDLSSYPLPNWNSGAMSDASPSIQSAKGEAPIHFEESAAAAGLTFQYYNGGNVSLGLKKMYEFSGGGAAVLDFDGDHWPDVYLTQGSNWPAARAGDGYVDRLFRNRGDGRFDEVTPAAMPAEIGFSQGVTVGDVNGDGFPDLYVGNIGANRLFLNNGDGTLSDATEKTGTAGGEWTTSCLLADVNGDGWPDLYAVNYLTGDDVFTRVCYFLEKPSLCLPQYFDGAEDRLYLNEGNGEFREVSMQTGANAADGRGLGIVAGDFSSSGRLDLFVANDMAPNFLLINRAAGDSEPRFVEDGLARGTALNEFGKSEACMGVAAGDADGDGLIDLFVTNFELESNTLYRQMPGGTFFDATQRAGLKEGSIDLLGFGTQFLDADLDGDLDLVIANGHIDDGREGGRPYRMPPQFYRNAGKGRFTEAEPGSLGSYFEGKYLGRGLARLDWNRDGREDFIVSHLDVPAALLTNDTEKTGRFLAVKLRGVVSSRDAIGATVRLKVGGRTLVRQLTAGDGYHASNQRLLTFGLGEDGTPEALEVEWPAGIMQRFSPLPVNRELLLIEGRSTPIELR